MRKQRKLLLSSFSLLLAIMFCVMGVYSALTNANWSISGKVSFDVGDIEGMFGVYEGKYTNLEESQIAYYDKNSVEEKDFSDTNTEWNLNEEYASFKRNNQSYFYHIVIRNNDTSRMYVYFELHNSLFTGDTPIWMTASSVVFVHENDDDNILKETAFSADSVEGALKIFAVSSSLPVSSFPTEIAQEYDEQGLNYVGQGSSAEYRKFSLRLEGNQTLSVMNFFVADIANATSDNRGETFDIKNAISINLEEPKLA